MAKMNFLNDYRNAFNEDLLMFYKGPFNNKILAGIGSYIREIMADQPELSYKVFSIFIELAQNISYHSEELPTFINDRAAKFGTLMIEDTKDGISISAGNFIKNQDIDYIHNQIEKVNSLDNDGLRKFKKEMRKLERGEHGEANIGLIQIAITAAAPVHLEAVPIIENYSFITITTTIKK